MFHQEHCEFGCLRGLCWRSRYCLDLFQNKNAFNIEDTKFMMSLAKLMKHNTKDCNKILYHVFGQIIRRVSSAVSHLLDKDIAIPVNIYESKTCCSGPEGFIIHDKLPCPQAYDGGGHTVMNIGDVIGIHFGIGKNILFT